MKLNRRNRDFNTPPIQPTSCFADIENLALIHQGQEELIRNTVASTIRTIPLFPRAMALNAFSDTRTNKTVNGITIAFLVCTRSVFFPADFHLIGTAIGASLPVAGSNQ